MQKIEKYLKIIFLILLSMTPIFWFFRRPGILIDGVDTNFPLDPSIWFNRRFFVWTAVSNTGADFSSSTAGTFFHFLQFLPFKLGLSLQMVEIINLLFWFSLIIFLSWYLSKLFFPKKNIPQIVFVVLYSLNIWLFNTWENVKVANLALAAAIPFGISILILLRNNKISRGFAAILSIVLGVILSGAGINPAYIVCFFIIILIYLISEIFVDFRDKKLTSERLKDFFVVSIFVILINTFWILPSLNFIFRSISSSNSIGSLGFTNWLDSLSENTSFINVLRMQGAWDWYSFDSVSRMPLYIPYAVNYFFNPLFLGFSFLIPSLAFLAFIFRKKKYSTLYVMFCILLVLGTFLTAGSHKPTGGLFNFFVRHLPFFSLFRSPWYIFAPLLVVAISGLVSIFFDNIEERIPKFLFKISGIVFIMGVLFYSYPLLLGKIYRPASTNGFFIKFPDYVFQVRDYLSKTNIDGRILGYPDDNIEKFKWGYSGTDSILNLFSDKEIVFSPLNDTTSPISRIVTNIYSAIKKNEITKVENLSSRLSITQVFDKKDQDSLSPDLPQAIINNKIASFGQWGFYNLKTSNNGKKIQAFSCCTLSYPYSDSEENLSVADNDTVLVNPSDSLLSKSDFRAKSGAVIHARNSQFEDYKQLSSYFDLKSKLVSRDLSDAKYSFSVSRNGAYSPIIERYALDYFGLINKNKMSVLFDGKQTVWNIVNSDDSFVYFQPILISEGTHELDLKLNNKNLINPSVYVQQGGGVFNFSNGIYNIFNQSEKDTAFNFPISDFDPYGYYLVSLSYKQTYGNNAQVLIDQRSKSTLFKDQTQAMPNYPDWQDFSFYYQPVQSDSSLSVSLVAPLTKDPLGTKIQYKNLVVSHVFDNNLFFKMDSVEMQKPGVVKYKEISPTFYSGSLNNGSGPQIIVMNENYSPGWELSVQGNSTARIFHFTGNYYANAWYIDGAGNDFNFNIEYKPQRLLKIGYVGSGITILIAIGYFLFERKNKYGRKN